MKDFLGDEELNLEQAACIARAMWKVAEAEQGVHQHEREMIDAFYQACVQEAGASPEDLSGQEWDVEEARQLLTTPGLKDVLVRSCFLLGFADGQCSPTERAVIQQMAGDLGVPQERFEALDREVKKMLLSQFGDIEVFRSVAYDIGKQLGLSPSDVDEVLEAE